MQIVSRVGYFDYYTNPYAAVCKYERLRRNTTATYTSNMS